MLNFKKENKGVEEKFMALSQVSILIVAIFAFAFIVGGMSFVSSAVDVTGQSTEQRVNAGQFVPYALGGYSIYKAATSTAPTPTSIDTAKIAAEAAKIETQVRGPIGGGITEPGLNLKEGFKNLYSINEGGLTDGLLAGVAWAATVFTLIKVVGGFLGVDQNKVDAAAYAAAGGLFVGKLVQGYVAGNGGNFLGLGAGTAGLIAGGAVAIGIFLLMYKNESTKIVTFECLPWEAPIGGSDCEKCNQQGILSCSEYQCRSLGQACQLLNKGTEDEKCAWVNRNDVSPPIMSLWEDVLTPEHSYTPDTAVSPPDRGVKIVNKNNQDGCIEAFTPLSFGIQTDEPAKCKLDYLRKADFDSMQFYFGGNSLFGYNHTQVLSLPGPNVTGENPILQNNGDYSLYARCQDANGNYDTATFVFNFCVEKGPDTTPPLIVTTDILDKSPIAFNQSSVQMSLFTNEPADCRWDKIDRSYDDMNNEFSCASSITEMNAQLLYRCTGNLTGLKNRENNDFYFRCKDQPLANNADRNVNAQSYKFTLIGTQPLVIDKVGPNETIRDSTDAVKVTLKAETSAGYKDGKAACYYSDSGDDNSYVEFFNTGSNKHSQDLFLPTGDYEYFIKCVDLGGNQDILSTEFKVETDTSAPVVARAYNEESKLKLVTTEKAECVYDTKSCSYQFGDGIKFTTVDDNEQFTDWNSKTTFYVKCQDEFGNQPLPNQCSIIVRPFDTYKS